MFPNKFVLFWNDEPIGFQARIACRCSYPEDVKYFNTREEAQQVADEYFNKQIGYGYPTPMMVKEIQFRIMDAK